MSWLLRHVFGALYPKTAFFPGIDDTDLRPFLRRFSTEAAPIMRLGVYAAAVLFVLLPVVTVRVPLPSFCLPRRLLDRHADRVTQLPSYPVRSLLLLLKMIAGMCFGAAAEVRHQLGLPPLPPDPGTWRQA